MLAQVILEYINKKTRALQQGNKIAAWAMCIVKGLMWLLEKIVAFINRNAFILVAGENICQRPSFQRQACLLLSGPTL